MLFKHCILKHFKFDPTEDQKTFIDLFSSFMTKRESHKTFLLKGYAGTGKTTLVSALVKTCKELNPQVGQPRCWETSLRLQHPLFIGLFITKKRWI